MNPQFEPLSDEYTIKRATGLEEFCKWVPVAGWMISSTLWERRHRPRHDTLCRQLERRTCWPADAWGSNPERQHVAVEVCKAIEREFVWPNFYFLPEDRLEFLLGTWRIGMEPLFVLVDIERRLNVRINRDVSFMRKALGEWVDELMLAIESKVQQST